MSSSLSDPRPLTQPPGLDSATLANLVRSVLVALPEEPGASAQTIAMLQESAVAAALGFRPRNAQEAMLAARVVIADRASVACFHNAGLPELPHSLALRYHGKAAALARLSTATAAELSALQKLPAPPVLRAGSAAAIVASFTGPAAAARAAAVPVPTGPAPANDGKDPSPSGAPAARLAANANATQDPIHREPLPPANARQHSMPGGAPAERPRSVIELPPTPEAVYSARLADEVMRLGRKLVPAGSK